MTHWQTSQAYQAFKPQTMRGALSIFSKWRPSLSHCVHGMFHYMCNSTYLFGQAYYTPSCSIPSDESPAQGNHAYTHASGVISESMFEKNNIRTFPSPLSSIRILQASSAKVCSRRTTWGPSSATAKRCQPTGNGIASEGRKLGIKIGNSIDMYTVCWIPEKLQTFI